VLCGTVWESPHTPCAVRVLSTTAAHSFAAKVLQKDRRNVRDPLGYGVPSHVFRSCSVWRVATLSVTHSPLATTPAGAATRNSKRRDWGSCARTTAYPSSASEVTALLGGEFDALRTSGRARLTGVMVFLEDERGAAERGRGGCAGDVVAVLDSSGNCLTS
jgi:hypothetical protein